MQAESEEPGPIWAGFLVAFSMVFLVGYSFVILVPDMPTPISVAVLVLMGGIWAVFLVDWLVRIRRAPDRWGYIGRHPIDTISAFIPVARPFHLLTYLRKLPYFRAASGGATRTHVLIAVALFASLFVYVVALGVLEVERDAAGATITDFGDAVWWACVTIATVGYGDMYPVTPLGRTFAVCLMLGGVAIVGAASATAVSYVTELTRHSREEREEREQADRDRRRRERAHDQDSDS